MTLPMLLVDDETSIRTDLASRRETKFVLRGLDVGKLRQVLESNTRRQIHAGEVSVVRSIYFDDVRLSAARANLDGLGRRRKLRLRWYDRLLPANEGYLEVKWRDNKVTGKHRLHIRSERPLGELNYRELHEALHAVAPQVYTVDLVRNHEPVIIVEYKREHFVSLCGKLRATIDYDLRFYDQTGKQRMSATFGKSLPNTIVLEGKTPLGRERELQAMFAPLRLRPAKFSKYVHGCRELGLVDTHD